MSKKSRVVSTHVVVDFVIAVSLGFHFNVPANSVQDRIGRISDATRVDSLKCKLLKPDPNLGRVSVKFLPLAEMKA